MPAYSNPFKPNVPVFRGMFAGRTVEIRRIETILQETKNGNTTNLLVIGERGIGKTSLILFAKFLASGDIPLDGDSLNYLTVFVSLDKRTTVDVFANKIKLALERELRKSGDVSHFFKDVWKFVQRLEVCNTRLQTRSETYDVADIFDNLTYSLVDTAKTITSQENALSKLGLQHPKDGLVIFIDEADNAPRSLDLGTLIKQLSEKLVAEDCSNVLIILAGLPEICQVLLESHGSSLRIFEELELLPLSAEDVKQVIRLGINEANKQNDEEVTITEKALDVIVNLFEGYPHFVQQFGYSSYAIDTDGDIDEDDVIKAAFIPGGATDLIGDRYYKDMYFNQIDKESYREVLKLMSEKWNEWISKKEIRSKFKGSGRTLDGALNALANRKIILKKPGARGIYRLQWLGFAFWIKIFATKFEKHIKKYNSRNSKKKSE